MKTRNGFVSNSSSSSFVAILREVDFNEFLKDQTAATKKLINSVVKKIKYCGIDSVIFSEYSDAGGGRMFEYSDKDSDTLFSEWIEETTEDMDEYDEDQIEDDSHDVIYNFTEYACKLEKEGKAVTASPGDGC